MLGIIRCTFVFVFSHFICLYIDIRFCMIIIPFTEKLLIHIIYVACNYLTQAEKHILLLIVYIITNIQAKALAFGSWLTHAHPTFGGLGIGFVRLNLIYDLVAHLFYDSLWVFKVLSAMMVYAIFTIVVMEAADCSKFKSTHFFITSAFVYFSSFQERCCKQTWSG